MGVQPMCYKHSDFSCILRVSFCEKGKVLAIGMNCQLLWMNAFSIHCTSGLPSQLEVKLVNYKGWDYSCDICAGIRNLNLRACSCSLTEGVKNIIDSRHRGLNILTGGRYER